MRTSFKRRVELALWAQEAAFLPDLAPPEDWPEAARLEGADCLPLWQGSYMTSLSAVFAAVNAIRLVATQERSLTAREEEELLAAALRWKADRGDPAFCRSLRKSDWPRLLGALSELFDRRHGRHLRLAQPWRVKPADRRTFMTGVERLVLSQHVVAILLAGANYSLIRGYTPSSLLLFDSGGRRWISRDALSLPGEAKRRRHHLVPAATLTLSRW